MAQGTDRAEAKPLAFFCDAKIGSKKLAKKLAAGGGAGGSCFCGSETGRWTIFFFQKIGRSELAVGQIGSQGAKKKSDTQVNHFGSRSISSSVS